MKNSLRINRAPMAKKNFTYSLLKTRWLMTIIAILTLGIGQMWGETTITITQSALGLTGSYTTNTEKTIDGVTFVYTDLMKSNDNIQAKASTGVIYNKTAIPGNITQIKVTHSGTARSTTVCYGISKEPTTNSTEFNGSRDITVSGSNSYFKITRGSNAAYWTSIEITYESTPSTYDVTLNRNGVTEVINEVAAGTTLSLLAGNGSQGGCSAWEFIGWSKTQREAQNNSTEMTLVTTVDDAGPYYAVYRHMESGGGGSATASMTSFSTVSGYVNGDENVSYEATQGTSSTAPAVNSNEIRIYQNGGLLTITGNGGKTLTSITVGSSMATKVQTKVDNGSFSSDNSISANGTYTLSNIEASTVVFKCTGTDKNSRLYLKSLSVTYSGGSTTYYSTTASCCAPLSSIHGSTSNATQNSLVLKWKQLSDQVSSWAVTYREKNSGNAFAAVTTSSTSTETISEVVYNKYTISGLGAGKTYEFKLTPTLKSGVCPLAADLIVEGTTESAYTISAETNNSTYGTVSISGNVITGSPKSGYRYATPAYTVSPAESATVAQDGNNFTVTPSANTTVTINFEAIPSYAVSWLVNGSAASGNPTTNVLEGGQVETLPTPPTVDGCDDGKTFVGWTATPIDGSTNTIPSDLFTTAGGSPAISGATTFYAVFVTPEIVGVTKTDNLNRATTGITGTSYTAWSGKTATTNAVYAGNSAGGNESIQLRSDNSNSGVITTTSGGKVKKVTVSWNSNTANGRTINIYGKNTAYEAATDLYDNSKQGTLLGSLAKGTTELNVTGNYEYIGIRSSSGALYLNSISILWETQAGAPASGYITSCAKQVMVEATEGGSATIDGEAAVNWVNASTEMALVATPAEGYVFSHWTSTGAEATFDDESAASTTVITDGAATITANFVAGSTISANKESLALVTYVNEGGSTTVTFTSSDAPQYGTVQYIIEDDTYISVSPASTYLSTSNLNATVTVSYGDDEAGSYNTNLVATAYNTNSVAVGTKIIPITLTIKPKFTVTAQADVAAHASAVSASPNANVKDGTTVTLSQTAADGWVFQKWTISYTLDEVAHNEDLVGNTFTMPAADVTATAVYTEKTGTNLDDPTPSEVASITSHSAVLSWSAVEHASSYSVYVVGTDYEETFDGITETSYTVTGLKAETEYMWSVTAIGDGEDYYDSPEANGPSFTTTARVLSSIAIKTNASKMTYNEGETFVKTGLEVTATYDDASTATISAASLVVTDEPLEVGTTSLFVSYTENAVEKTTTLTGITVNELKTVTWSANGVTNVVKYAEGQAISFPPSASGCFGKSFVGWSESTIDGETDDAPTLVTSATMGATNKIYYAVFAIVENSNEEKSYGFEDSEPDASYWTVSDAIDATSGQGNGSSSYAGKINTNDTYVTFKDKVNVTEFSFAFKRTSNNNNYNVYIETSENGTDWTAAATYAMSTFSNGSYQTKTKTFDGETALYVRFHCSNSTAVRYVDDVHIAYSATTGSKYATSCCTPNSITISDAIEHGSVSTGEVTSACEGTEITLSASADEGYEFGAWTVMQGEDNITSTNVAGNVLTMPDGDVTVSASFNKIAVTGVTINGLENVQINNDVVWTLDITPSTARPEIIWSSASDAIATVSNGTVHGVAEGSTTITATVDGTPYNKTINVIRETKLNSLTVVDPKTAYTLNEAFVAPQVNANYVYVDDESAAPSIEDVAAEFTGFNNQSAGEQTITVSYGGKSTTYDITVSSWTLKLQTKRMYGNDIEKETVVDAEVTTLASPTDLTGYYVAGLCEGYTQLGYITSSENIDALPAEVLTEYTPSANNEMLYGVFQKTNYEGEDLLTENFSSQEAFNTNFPTKTGYTGYSEGKLQLGSGSQGGNITSKELNLSHNFKVEVSAQRYGSDNSTLHVEVGSTAKQQTLTSSYVAYTFDFDATESTTVLLSTDNAKDKRININSIRIYTVDDMEYTSVYDCREPIDVEYVIGNDKVVWTACENTTVMEGQSYTLCANEPSLQGYDFGGWIINGDEENVKAAGTSVEVAEDLTITPKFTEHVYDYSYALAATATNGTIASVTVNGIAKDLAEVALHDGDAVVVTATPNTNYEISEWTHSENIASLTTDGNTASFTVAASAGDMTITAVFVEKAQYSMTLNVFGRTYTTKQGHEGDTYSSVLAGAESPALTGYTFQGWSTDADDADAIITGEELLTADVTLYAIVGSLQPTGYVYNKVTSLGDITDDGYYLIVNETANKAFDGSRNSSSDLNALNNFVAVTISENKIISNADIDAAIVTIGAVPETERHYIKTATGYYIGNTGSNGLLANKNTVYQNTLSFSDGNFVVVPKDYDMVLRFNATAGNGKFGYYGGTQNPIQLYKRGDVHEEIIPEAEPAIEISTEVSASTSFPGGYVGDVTVVNGGSLNADINLSVGDLIIHSTLGKGTGTGNGSGNNPGNCGQIANGSNITVNGDVYLELELTQDAAASAGWYAFSVPFPVDALNGVYYGETKLTNEVGYAIMSHDGALRAENKYAWKKFRGIMQPGVFYVITVGNTDYKTLRFKKVAGKALVASTDVAVSPFPSQTGNDADGAWNGIGNPNLQISNLATSFDAPMQFYDHKTNSFNSRIHSMNLVVGSAFFIQYNATSTVSIPAGTTSHNGYLAPARYEKTIEDEIFQVSLVNVLTEEEEDNVFFTARVDATTHYEIGRDVAKLSMGTAKCAQITISAYGTNLCAADFPLVNDKASYPLTVTTPAAGDYRIELAEAYEDATIYLTYEGRVIWNLSMSPYEVELQQGQTEGYGLRLVAAPQTPTDIENTDALNGANGVQKVIIDEHVYILRGEQLFDVTGKAAR